MENWIINKKEEFEDIKSGCEVGITLIGTEEHVGGIVVENNLITLCLRLGESHDTTIWYDQIKSVQYKR